MATPQSTGPRRGKRMSGEERRAQILDVALRVFARGSYAAATTASIAREAGISEPVLYHHFANKAALYVACLEHVWTDVHARWDAAIAAEPEPARWLARITEIGFAALDDENDTARLWLHALTDVSDDEGVRPSVLNFTAQLHEYVTGVFERSQAAGAVDPDLEPRGEAWIFLSVGILRAISRRLGGIVDPDFPSVVNAMQISYVPR